ncbi:alpha/beta fold hydrolase [Amaricoccus solimangrovi]|uniref:Alpha/beta hydrolase n=1 Tax=Amaricoccus solimangrovi TaxID=2589815 RepID=A0A501WWS9_9RHOB|nr:alpha/beta hydrolase [Amaricoccus solimangrovi]TPE53729.1 alpha/beta hydrolase [Amaricoccus solimangrovi]
MRDEIPPGVEEGAVILDGTPIRYVRSGSGPAVALIHGASANLGDMSFGLLPRLAARYTVVAFDRPGHGGSGWPARGGEQLEHQARMLRAALSELGVERAILVGHSYGGAVALAWTLEFPESVAGLLLLGAPSQGWEGGMGLANDLLAHPVTAPWFSWTLPGLMNRMTVSRLVDVLFAPQRPPRGLIAHVGPGRIFTPETLRANAVQLQTLRRQLLAMVPRYPGIRVPVEILHGTEDGVVSYGFHAPPLAAMIPRARLTPLPGVGHMVHHAAPEEVERALARLAAG